MSILFFLPLPSIGAPLTNFTSVDPDTVWSMSQVQPVRRKIFEGPVGAVQNSSTPLAYDEDGLTWQAANNQHTYLQFINCLGSGGSLQVNGVGDAVVDEVKAAMPGVPWTSWTPAELDSGDPNYNVTVAQYCYNELRDYFREPVIVSDPGPLGATSMIRPKPNHILPYLHNGNAGTQRRRVSDEILAGNVLPAAARITHGHHVDSSGTILHHLVGWVIYLNEQDASGGADRVFSATPYPVEDGGSIYSDATTYHAQVVVGHEMLHVLGLRHIDGVSAVNNDISSAMTITASETRGKGNDGLYLLNGAKPGQATTPKWNLLAADRAFLRRHYPGWALPKDVVPFSSHLVATGSSVKIELLTNAADFTGCPDDVTTTTNLDEIMPYVEAEGILKADVDVKLYFENHNSDGRFRVLGTVGLTEFTEWNSRSKVVAPPLPWTLLPEGNVNSAVDTWGLVVEVDSAYEDSSQSEDNRMLVLPELLISEWLPGPECVY